ncbi:response regulator [Adhaeretor mobilis]|uniref:Putative transcriptional regulatory protein pdtaR n=1 Tax=Adhaeretor mobilis TaxID=1930276 RepID=A0A517MZE0_9BACT|nr:response regulator [Adhaeretor mobilis]QDT00252.1 putative transcriptional regulatory protein pdtaR [Adhaeretor mobilis]
MCKSLRIAIADDEPEVLEYFSGVLRSLGHQVVIQASNGRELLDACRTDRPQLLITDIGMDKIPGIEAMRALSANVPMPTILISALSEGDESLSESDAQVLAFLSKPVKLATFTGAVKVAVDHILQ